VVRLGDVARVSVQPVPNLIERENSSRRIDVVANVGGRDLARWSTTSRRRSPECGSTRYHAELLGEYKARQGRAAAPVRRRHRRQPGHLLLLVTASAAGASPPRLPDPAMASWAASWPRS